MSVKIFLCFCRADVTRRTIAPASTYLPLPLPREAGVTSAGGGENVATLFAQFEC